MVAPQTSVPEGGPPRRRRSTIPRLPYSILRVLGSPITRFLTSESVRRTALGRRIYMRLYLFGKNRAESREQEWFRQRLRQGMTVIDMGANVGFYTMLFAEIVGERGKVHAFEPDPFCHRILSDRIRKLTVQNVRLEAAALGSIDGDVTFHCSRRDRAENRVHPFDRAVAVDIVRVPQIRFDDYCRRHGIEEIDAVKMDVEGAEVSVLEGMRERLATRPPSWMWIEFSPDQLRVAGASSEAFWEALIGSGYCCYAVDRQGRAHRIRDTSAFSDAHAHGDTNIWAVHRAQPQPQEV
jgi:FkbM family methyltransferase